MPCTVLQTLQVQKRVPQCLYRTPPIYQSGQVSRIAEFQVYGGDGFRFQCPVASVGGSGDSHLSAVQIELHF